MNDFDYFAMPVAQPLWGMRRLAPLLLLSLAMASPASAKALPPREEIPSDALILFDIEFKRVLAASRLANDALATCETRHRRSDVCLNLLIHASTLDAMRLNLKQAEVKARRALHIAARYGRMPQSDRLWAIAVLGAVLDETGRSAEAHDLWRTVINQPISKDDAFWVSERYAKHLETMGDFAAAEPYRAANSYLGIRQYIFNLINQKKYRETIDIAADHYRPTGYWVPDSVAYNYGNYSRVAFAELRLGDVQVALDHFRLIATVQPIYLRSDEEDFLSRLVSPDAPRVSRGDNAQAQVEAAWRLAAESRAR